MGNAFNLGKLFGIQFRLHYTWFIVFVLVVISLSTQYFPTSYPGWSHLVYWTIGVITSLLFFASVVAHELAHSFVARVNGIPVKNITLFSKKASFSILGFLGINGNFKFFGKVFASFFYIVYRFFCNGL